MVKQVVTSFLWFFTVAWGWNYVALVTGLPMIIGMALGAAAAAFVWFDPFHLIRAAEPEIRSIATPSPISQPVQRPA
jgi:hypothetical protein